jgi:hypothetical protein
MSLRENRGSIQAVSFLVRIQALGQSVPSAENRVYPAIFRPQIRPSRYHGSCISVMSSPLTLNALRITFDAAMLLQVGLNK